MSTYVGKLQIGANGDLIPIGSTLFGTCSNDANVSNKTVTLAAFDRITHGVTVHIRFDKGNSVTSNLTLSINGTTAYPITGNFVCGANTIIEFTFDEVSGTDKFWRVNGVIPEIATASPSAIATTANIGSSTKYAKEDHVHNIVLAEGTTDGTVKIAGTDVAVHGLQTGAYADISLYATLNSPEFTGSVIIPNGTNNANEAANKGYVDSKISEALTGAVDAMIFKGTIGSSGATRTALPTPADGYDAGWTYKIITAGDYGNSTDHLNCEVGDLIIAINNNNGSGSSVVPTDWTVAQGNLDGTVTTVNGEDGYLVKFTGTHSIAKLVAISNNGTGFLKQDGSWAVPTNTTYSFTDGAAYTAHALTGENGASILASVTGGVLTLAQGIKFTTGPVGASLDPDS